MNLSGLYCSWDRHTMYSRTTWILLILSYKDELLSKQICSFNACNRARTQIGCELVPSRSQYIARKHPSSSNRWYELQPHKDCNTKECPKLCGICVCPLWMTVFAYWLSSAAWIIHKCTLLAHIPVFFPNE
jgi:hypothetical protein